MPVNATLGVWRVPDPPRRSRPNYMVHLHGESSGQPTVIGQGGNASYATFEIERIHDDDGWRR